MIANKNDENELMNYSNESIDEEIPDFDYNNNQGGNFENFNLGMESETPFPFNLSTKKNARFIGEFTFKNYIPVDKSFQMQRLNYFETIVKVEKEYEKKVRKAIKEFINIEKNPLSIVPKKNNIDLKRNLGSKLAKLNRRTEIAILELIKDNLAKNTQGINGNQDQNDNNTRDANNYYREEDGVMPNKQAGRNLVNATNKRIELDQNEDHAENISDLDD